MKKKQSFFIGFAAVLLAAMVMLAGCGDSLGSPASGDPKATLRYETVPYVGSGSVYAVDDPNLNNLVYSAYDDTQYYYLFLLGNVNRVPLAYRQASEYNGTTNINIGYSKSDISEKSITDSVETANEYTTTQSTKYTWGAEVEVSLKFGEIVSGRVQASAGGEYGWDKSNSRSYSNTYETALTTSSGDTDDISVTIGENGEPAGLYRFSLFTTTDVYFVVITDHDKTVLKSYLAYCARPQTYWALDYEPDLTGDFGKTASGSLLKTPDITPDDLPTPESNDVQPLPGDITGIPYANLPAKSYEGPQNVTLYCDTPNATIYYTIDGSTPTLASKQYTKVPIPIEEDTTLQAIAKAAGKETSGLMQNVYTITAQVLQTSWYFNLREPGTNRVTDSDRGHQDYLSMSRATDYKNYERDKLIAAGYTAVTFEGQFDAKQINEGYAGARIRQGHGQGTVWSDTGRNLLLKTSWKTLWFQNGRASLAEFGAGDFTLHFDAHGAGKDDWDVGHTWVRVTAVKP